MQKMLKCKKYKNKKLSGASYQIKNAKTQKEQNKQKEQKNKNCTFAPAISTSYLLLYNPPCTVSFCAC